MGVRGIEPAGASVRESWLERGGPVWELTRQKLLLLTRPSGESFRQTGFEASPERCRAKRGSVLYKFCSRQAS